MASEIREGRECYTADLDDGGRGPGAKKPEAGKGKATYGLQEEPTFADLLVFRQGRFLISRTIRQ